MACAARATPGQGYLTPNRTAQAVPSSPHFFEPNGTAYAVRTILGVADRGCLALRASGTPGYCYSSASRTKPCYAARLQREKMSKVQRPPSACWMAQDAPNGRVGGSYIGTEFAMNNPGYYPVSEPKHGIIARA